MPPLACSNRPDAVAVGAGERPLDVAEQLALEQALRQGGAVDLDERPARARAGLVDRRGQELLARAALAPDQHGRVGWPRPCGPWRSSCRTAALEPLIASKTPEVAVAVGSSASSPAAARPSGPSRRARARPDP